MKISRLSIARSITNYLCMHLFLTIVSLPILVAWGLPISWLSPVGNFIFSPLLSSFLLICSLAFFSELFHLPHGFLDWMIEAMTKLWHWMLNLAPQSALYGIWAPAPWILATIAVMAIIGVTHPWMRTTYRRFGVLTILFTLTLGCLALATPRFFIKQITCNNGSLTLIRSQGQTILIDPGYLGSRGNTASFVAYTLMPELIAATGSLTIDHCIILKPSIGACDGISRLLDDARIGHLYFPAMTGDLEGSFKRSFGRMYAKMKGKNIPYTPLAGYVKKISPSTACSFVLAPQKQVTYYTISYSLITLSGQIEGTSIAVEGR